MNQAFFTRQYTQPDGTVAGCADNEMFILKYGKADGFRIRCVIESQEGNSAFNLLQELAQVQFYMSSGDHDSGDVEQGLRMLSNAKTYFTTWRSGTKLAETGQESTLTQLSSDNRQLKATVKHLEERISNLNERLTT